MSDIVERGVGSSGEMIIIDNKKVKVHQPEQQCELYTHTNIYPDPF